MQRRLADEGTTVSSVDLIRKRLSGSTAERPEGDAPAPKPQRKSSATNRRQRQLAEALVLVEALKDDLQATLDGWGDSFAGSDRSERFTAAVAGLEVAAEVLGEVDVSW